MANLNNVQLIGRLGAAPEVRALDNGQAVATFNLAISEYWKDRATGERKERTEWVRIEAWGATAKQAQQLLAKGREIHVAGRLKTRQWEKDGETRYFTSVVCHRFQLLGPRPGATTGQVEPEDQLVEEQPEDLGEAPGSGYEGEEIPF